MQNCLVVIHGLHRRVGAVWPGEWRISARVGQNAALERLARRVKWYHFKTLSSLRPQGAGWPPLAWPSIAGAAARSHAIVPGSATGTMIDARWWRRRTGRGRPTGRGELLFVAN